MTQNTEPSHSADHVEMSKYGITRQTVDYYLVDGFRYTSLKDAVAQAKRILNTDQ